MLVRTVEADNFLVFGGLVKLTLGPGLTVVTGPNGAGKTSLGLCLDLAQAVVGMAAGDAGARRADSYIDAGHDDAQSYSVALGLELDREDERRLVWAFVCASYACMMAGNVNQPQPDEADVLCRDWLTVDALAPLFVGRLIVRHVSGSVQPWFAAWEFEHGDGVWNIGLVGVGTGQLRRGPANPFESAGGSAGIRQWLLSGKPQDRDVFDLGTSLSKMTAPVSFSVPPLMSGPGSVPESLRELAPELSVSDFGSRSFSFGYVLAWVLRRGLVLTDNRRLPMQLRFTSEDLSKHAQLRDGSGVAAVLYQLKNGDALDQERFGRIQANFKALTGRPLDVRVRHVPSHEDGGILIEPVVTHSGRQRPVAFCGAGIQEALLLSVLLVDNDGKVVVLDEPAVNLEPTVQRRLLRRLRGPGQCVVITHHADLVPVEEPQDLDRVVRIVPGPGGSEVLRPDLSGQRQASVRRLMRLMDPVHVRGLLFAPAVILCEGGTETGALPRWWRAGAEGLDLRDPEAANIPLVDVGGDSGFGAYVQFLDAFRIAWVIVCDGPALRCDSKMAKQLADLGQRPDPVPGDREDFAGWRKAWEKVGVFTVADQFGDDGLKGGEFEALLEQTDPDLLASIRNKVGRGGKPIVGSWFAADHSEPPGAVLSVYQKIASYLGPDLVPGFLAQADSR